MEDLLVACALLRFVYQNRRAAQVSMRHADIFSGRTQIKLILWGVKLNWRVGVLHNIFTLEVSNSRYECISLLGYWIVNNQQENNLPASEICHTLSWCDAGACALTLEQRHLNPYSTPQSHLWHPQAIFDTQKHTLDTGATELTQSQASEICHTLSWYSAGARALMLEM